MVDHSGEPAVRVTLVVKNADEKMLEDGDALNVVARQVHLAIDAAGVVRWPYTDFVVAREAA